MNLEISTHAREATHEQNGPGLQAIAEESGCSFDPMEIVHVVSRWVTRKPRRDVWNNYCSS